MAMGTRKWRQRQESLWYDGELAAAPGHSFYRRLNDVLEAAGFDRFCETECAGFYHHKLGRPSMPPGQYFVPAGQHEVDVSFGRSAARRLGEATSLLALLALAAVARSSRRAAAVTAVNSAAPDS